MERSGGCGPPRGRRTIRRQEKSKFPFGEPGSGFSSYWDEEWFGLMSVSTGAGRRPDSPVLLTAATAEGR